MNATVETETEVRPTAPPSRGDTEINGPRLIKRSVTEDQICVLTFDRPDSAANIFDKAALVELNQHLDFVAANEQRQRQGDVDDEHRRGEDQCGEDGGQDLGRPGDGVGTCFERRFAIEIGTREVTKENFADLGRVVRYVEAKTARG